VNSPAALQLGFDKIPRLGVLICSLLLVFVVGLGETLAAGRDDPHTIVVGSKVNSEAVEAFEISHGRDPNEAELGELHRVWIENEVLYREGLERQRGMVDIVDLGRDRLITNALSPLDASLELPPMDDAKLRDWFEKQRARYDQPARYDFQEATNGSYLDHPAESAGRSTSAAQDSQDFFEFLAKLTHDLLRLRYVVACFLALQAIAGAANGEALFIQEAADLADHQHILALVVTTIATALDRFELRKLLLPIAQHMRLDAAQLADLTDGEVAFAGNRREFAVIACFQHMPRLEPLVFVRVEMSLHGER